MKRGRCVRRSARSALAPRPSCSTHGTARRRAMARRTATDRRLRRRGAPGHPGPRGPRLRVPGIGRGGGSAGRMVGLVRDHRRAERFQHGAGRGAPLPRVPAPAVERGASAGGFMARKRRALCGLSLAHAVGDTDHAARQFILSYPAKRYRSALIGIAVHSAQSIVVLGLVLASCQGLSTRARPRSVRGTGRRIGGPFCAPHASGSRMEAANRSKSAAARGPSRRASSLRAASASARARC